jgi:Flp pilus assembly protein TadD
MTGEVGGRGVERPAASATSETYELFQQGRTHLRSGRAAQATVALEKAKRREPEKASIREALGIAYFRLRRWDEAAVEFSKLVELAPVDHFAHRALARTLDRLGRPGDAAQHHALARALEPAGRARDG